jgi:hypothetical protein
MLQDGLLGDAEGDRKVSLGDKIKPGDRFGKLVAIEATEPRVRKGKRGNPRPVLTWLFACDCGARKDVVLSDLFAGDAMSCGSCKANLQAKGLKVCPGCKLTLPLSSFAVRRAKRSGLQPRCRGCAAVAMSASYRKDIDKSRAYRREHANLDGKMGERLIANYSKFPLKREAHNTINRELKGKRITKPDHCSACGDDHRVEGHHDDYTKPLDVIWLCTSCHRKRHKELKAAGRDPELTAIQKDEVA